MNCQYFKELIFDYLEAELEEALSHDFEHHLENCRDCQHSLLESQELWKLTGNLPTPSPEQKDRFHASLKAYQKGIEEGELLAKSKPSNLLVFSDFRQMFQRPMMHAAGLLFMFAAGVITTLTIHQSDIFSDGVESQRLVVGKDMQALQQEVNQLREMTVLSMLQQSTSSERLKGVNWVLDQRSTETSPRVLAALFSTLSNDPSTSVKMAAVDALGSYADDYNVRGKIIHQLATKHSEFVRIELMKVLANYQDDRVLPILTTLRDDPEENEVVREMARWSILRITETSQPGNLPQGNI